MSPARLRELRAELVRWNDAQDRAREEYLTHPVSHEVPVDNQCSDPWCSTKAKGRTGLCEYHYRHELYMRKKAGVAGA